ncbi:MULTISPECIES: UPF0715 family protein [Bacillus]|uniref:UPF0715 family protein n=1 Tax=Bacillus TaxID=1386 RepID=UPI00049A2F7D|nr:MULTISPECIES: UPF0715 family protein [Bacillus]MBL3637949.1 UPF0715 family protein [Alkalicoccobacillus gibsonii]AIC98336.1 hypothetical protein Q433_10315 [Bacillus subtilis subsp. subtilis str. OH 131.1]AIX07527.1 hypothetical protein OB04_01867 [Bacillus subtilis]AMK72427.1 hypothetical protein AWV81_09925 [Bacillus subtilis subsp. natto]AMR47147.1 hypothetical protein KHRBS_12265 [Bacillus subtilis subsp. subtilis]
MQVLRIIFVHVLSALSAAVVYVFGIGYDGYIPYFLISVLLFIFYLIFAAPVQYFLNRNPKRFNAKYLLIYIFFSFLVWLFFAFITDPKNTLNFLMGYEIYLFSVSFAVIFWIWDSVFLQNIGRVAA